VLPILMRYGLWLLGFWMLAALLMAGLTQSNRDSRSSALAAETAPADESASERPRTYEQLPGVVHMLPEACRSSGFRTSRSMSSPSSTWPPTSSISAIVKRTPLPE